MPCLYDPASFSSLLFWLVITLCVQGICLYKRFYSLSTPRPILSLPWLLVVLFFLVYFICPPLFLFVTHLPPSPSTHLLSLISLLGALALTSCLLPPCTLPQIISTSPLSWRSHCLVGILSFLPAFPTVALFSQIADLTLIHLFHICPHEQVAVEYFKQALHSPSALSTALALVLIFAPLIEEWLFRGILQNYLRQFCSTRLACILTAAAFALLHFDIRQGMGNFSLLPSLFLLGLFLGFLYEKQRSLLAPISLHATFNGCTALSLLLFP